VLLVHGLGSRLEVWDAIADRLAASREVIAVDLPGFGSSARFGPDRTPDPPGLARAVADFLDEIEVPAPRVVGNSLGGTVALELGRLGRVSSVLCVSPAGFPAAWERRLLNLSLRMNRRVGTMPTPVHRMLARRPLRFLALGQVSANPGRVCRTDALRALEGLRLASDYDRTRRGLLSYRLENPHEIKVPVTIAWGTKDHLTLPGGMARAASLLPQARIVALEGSGHVPMWDDPDRLTGLILAD